jgi:hypothetical protein
VVWPDDPPRPLLLAMDSPLARLQVLAVLVVAAGAEEDKSVPDSVSSRGALLAAATSPPSSPLAVVLSPGAGSTPGGSDVGPLSPSSPLRFGASPGSRAARYSVRTLVRGARSWVACRGLMTCTNRAKNVAPTAQATRVHE